MTDINETVSTVLHLDAEATPGPWRYEPRWGDIYDNQGDPPFSHRRGATTDYSDGSAVVGDGEKEVVYEGTFVRYEQTAGHIGIVEEDRTLIAYYRTAAPALAREVQRLQDRVSGVQISHDCALVAAYESGHRAGQEAMRERCASRAARDADGACNCGRPICPPDCARVRLLDLADAIRALEVEP